MIIKTSRRRQPETKYKYLYNGTTPKRIYRQHKASTQTHKTQEIQPEEGKSIAKVIRTIPIIGVLKHLNSKLRFF